MEEGENGLALCGEIYKLGAGAERVNNKNVPNFFFSDRQSHRLPLRSNQHAYTCHLRVKKASVSQMETSPLRFLLACASAERVGELHGTFSTGMPLRGLALSLSFSFMPDFVAKTQNPSVPDDKFNRFSVRSVLDFVSRVGSQGRDTSFLAYSRLVSLRRYGPSSARTLGALNLCRDLVIVISWEKSDVSLVSKVQYLGILLDTIQKRVYPMDSRIVRF